MGRSDYLVTAGIGFDLDRSSAKKSIAIFEGLAGALNAKATHKAKEQFAQTEKDYDNSIKKLKTKEKNARKKMEDGTKKSAKAAQDALDSSKMRPPSKASKAQIAAAGGLKKYQKDYERTINGMKNSYSKFQKEAKKMGMDVAGKTKVDLEKFAKKDVETRKRLIGLNKRMIKDEKERLKHLTKGSHAYKNLEKEIKALSKQEKAMSSVSEDRYQQERKLEGKKRKWAKKERAADQKRIKSQKKIVAGLKNQQRAYAKLGQVASATAGKIKSGMTNAFVIGTAAATAFFVKMQPLSETVTEFEKTIVNANSVFNVTQKELYEVSDSMVQFTLRYGVSAQDTATGLYQLASAGLSAADSQEVLQSTMKLAMATQGDHNTLAKLTVQTIMGFGMEMSQVEDLTDKFAHSIQKSLIEWQDLASSVKFAMPFFVATGQSIDELLGGLEVLTNRALEAGIAGRGLRQALAQFAKHADDNSSALAKLGVQIMDTEGNMRDLHKIAQDASAAFGDVTDLEALTAMLEDMNVRGATAFALLVQNADEFEAAVGDLQNSAGEATQMADIQQQSLAMQIQLVKNALLAPFLFADEVGEANDTLNAFTHHISELVQEFTEFFIVTLPDGTQALTEHSTALKEFVINALTIAVDMISQLKDIFLENNNGMETFTTLLNYAVYPMQIMLDILEYLGPNALNYYVQLKVITAIFPVMNLLTLAGTYLQMRWMASMIGTNKATKAEIKARRALKIQMLQLMGVQKGAEAQAWKNTLANWAVSSGLFTQATACNMLKLSWMGLALAMGAAVGFMAIAVMSTGAISDAMLGLAAIMVLVASLNIFDGWMDMTDGNVPVSLVATVASVAALFGIMAYAQSKGQRMFGNKNNFAGAVGPAPAMPTERTYDSGGVVMSGMYDSGGPTTEHSMAILQKGETVIPKTRNMLEGGITLNIGGDIVTDNADDFAERIAEVLPEALRKQNDIGGF